MENSFLKDLEKYFKETPQEKILEDWKKSESFDNVGITVDEFLKNIKKNITKKKPKVQAAMKKGKPLTIKEFKELKNGDYIHLEYYNDEGFLVCNNFVKLNITVNKQIVGYDADCYPIPIDYFDNTSNKFVEYPEDTLLENRDNSGYIFTVRKAIKKI